MLKIVNLISNYSNKDIPSGSINMTQREGNSLQKNSSLGKHFGLLLHPPPANPPIDNNPGLSTNHVSITGTGYINWNCTLSKDFRDLVTHSEFLVGFRGIWFNCTGLCSGSGYLRTEQAEQRLIGETIGLRLSLAKDGQLLVKIR